MKMQELMASREIDIFYCVALQLRGYGMSADAFHITQPPPDGRGAALAMRRALKEAAARPDDVAYVNAHGTGTPLGDAAELRAIAQVFNRTAAAADAEDLQDSSSHEVRQTLSGPHS